jgi:hypothetical protein
MFCNLSEEALAECSWRLTCCSKTSLFTKRSLENGMCVFLFSDICLHFSLSLSLSLCLRRIALNVALHTSL